MHRTVGVGFGAITINGLVLPPGVCTVGTPGATTVFAKVTCVMPITEGVNPGLLANCTEEFPTGTNADFGKINLDDFGLSCGSCLKYRKIDEYKETLQSE